MTTLADLLNESQWPEIRAALSWLYPRERESLDGYERTARHLRTLTPEPGAMRIAIRISEETDPEDDTRRWHEVFGMNGTLNRDQPDFKHYGHAPDSAVGMAETHWSLSMTPWEQWLGMQIDPGTLSAYPPAQLLAHCLWEMTFHGFTQEQVGDVRDELQRRIAELDAMSPEDREKNLISHEEVRERLKGIATNVPREDDRT